MKNILLFLLLSLFFVNYSCGRDEYDDENTQATEFNHDSTEDDDNGNDSNGNNSKVDENSNQEGSDLSTDTIGNSDKSEEPDDTIQVYSFKGKTISILGNSISTYSGYVNNNRTYYPRGDVNSVNRTWWMILINMLEGQFYENYSYSAGRVTNTHPTFPSLIYQVNRLSHSDILFLTGGINDSSTGVKIGTLDFNCDINDLSESEFAQAYDKYVRIALTKADKVYCVIMSGTKTSYSDIIHSVARQYELLCIDLNDIASKISMYKHPHPSYRGMKTIAEYIFTNIYE